MSKESYHNFITLNSPEVQSPSESKADQEKATSLNEFDSFILRALTREIMSEKGEIEEAKHDLEQSQPSHIDDVQDQARHLMQSAELTGQAVQLEKIAKYVSTLMKQWDVIIEQTQEQKDRNKELYEKLQDKSE